MKKKVFYFITVSLLGTLILSAACMGAEVQQPDDKTIMTIEVPEDTPIADSDGEIPGADASAEILTLDGNVKETFSI